MLNPRLDLPLPARLLLGAADAPSVARELAQRSGGAVRGLSSRGKTKAETPEAGDAPEGTPAPLEAVWSERSLESLPYGCVAVIVPLRGGTPVERLRLLTELEAAARASLGGQRIDVSVGPTGPARITIVRELLETAELDELLRAATLNRSVVAG